MAGAETAWADLLEGVALERLVPGSGAQALAGREQAQALERAGVVEFARASSSTATPMTVLVNDSHRPTDSAGFLRALFLLLDAAGVTPGLRLLVAAGSHRADDEEKLAHEQSVLGPYADRFAEIAWHDAADTARLSPVGDYQLHSWMAEGGWYLACGSVEPHYFAGLTGAHKTLSVGVMSLKSLAANHEGAMSPDAAGLRLDGNPVYEGVAAVVTALENSGARLLALNQVLLDGELVGVSAGHPLASLHELLPLMRSSFVQQLAAPVDLLVARVAPPLDRDFYQADKGIKNTEAAVSDGGLLLLEAACAGGTGIDHFVELMRACPDHASALATVRDRGYRLGDHKAVRLRALTDLRGVRLALVSKGVDPALEAALGMRIFAGREEAAAWARGLLPASSRGLLVEDAGNVTLEIKEPGDGA